MSNKISKISKIEIKSLWGRFDLTWHLQPDVNILSGINGSGKSTILDCIAVLLSTATLPSGLGKLLQSLKIVFDNGKYIALKRVGNATNLISLDKLGITLNEFHNLIKIDIISTFDNMIPKDVEYPDKNVKTELDKYIFDLQKKYLDYQLNVGKKVFEAVTQNNGRSQEDVLNIKKQQERFIEIIDNLFKDTDKKIDRKKNEIVFLSGNDEISAYQLSSGEKQILIILLTVLVQDNMPSIILMDEPEISLHFDWQKKLIQYVRELNPNTQIILATHSPAIIMEGWRDKVFDVRDLTTFDNQKSKK
ncbi:MAG: ATP-binding protein [Bacteroidetes bacterium]|nr:MAG: ATP-binding protein [Bacteroidota bacterium]